MVVVAGVLGQDGHILIGHENYNSGLPIGFLLHKNNEPKDKKLRSKESAAFSIQIGVNAQDDPITFDKAYFMPIILGRVSNPDGSVRDEVQDRIDLYNLLGQGEGIFIQTDAGTYVALEADDHVITETQYSDYTIASVRISATNAVFLPIPNERILASTWKEGDEDDAVWGGDEIETNQGYWR